MWYSVRFRPLLLLLLLALAHHASRAQQAGPDALSGYEAHPRLPAGTCCVAPAPAAPDWMFVAVAAATGHPGSLARLNPLTGYAAGHHLRFMSAWRTLPTGLADRPDRPAQARGSAYSLVGAGASYRLSPTLRATSSWATGLGRNSVVPGNQFTLGVAVKY